jgi:hypothetical protein
MANFNKYGFKGCLKKPFNMQDVGRLLKNLIETKSIV